MTGNSMSMGEPTLDRNSSRVKSDLVETQLEILFQVSQVLSRSLRLRETLKDVINLLNDLGSYRYCFVTLLDEEVDAMTLSVAHSCVPMPQDKISYDRGEGILGQVIETGETVLVPRISEEPKFLSRLNVFDPNLPFIAAPINSTDDAVIGILAAQPPAERSLLGERTRFIKMVANLISQTVRLHREVQDQRDKIEKERDSLQRKVKVQHGFDNIIGHAAPMRDVFERIRLVAKWNTTVLVRGESGTGKELIASAIHYNSPRANAPFIKLNCAAIPDNLLETELFGHEKGAFTGAAATRKGRFELADGGTLFLDEIGEISGAFQAKILRVLQEGEFERVGGSQTMKVDVRIIAATNAKLEDAVERGDFREDLYYRLNVMLINMPPLRDRAEDIPELAQFLLQKVARQQGRDLKMTEDAIRMLVRHRWPGNVRELENTIERAAIMSENSVVDCPSIELAGAAVGGASVMAAASTGTGAGSGTERGGGTDASALDINDPDLDERQRVIAALEQAGWVQAKAARLLDMTPRQIAYRIQTLKIDVRQF